MRAFAQGCLAQVYVVVGKLREAQEMGERALAFFESQCNVWWACRTLWFLSTACNAIGEWERGFDYCRRALEHGQAVNDLRLKIVGWYRTGSTHMLRGDADAAVRCFDEALKLSPIPFDATLARAFKGFALAKAGQVAGGDRPAEGRPRLAGAVPNPVHELVRQRVPGRELPPCGGARARARRRGAAPRDEPEARLPPPRRLDRAGAR